MLLGGILMALAVGYSRPAPAEHPCSRVARVYQSTYAEINRDRLRGSQDRGGLTLAESVAIDAANAASKGLGVSCFIDGGSI
jgi:hypothetical protein